MNANPNLYLANTELKPLRDYHYRKFANMLLVVHDKGFKGLINPRLLE